MWFLIQIFVAVLAVTLVLSGVLAVGMLIQGDGLSSLSRSRNKELRDLNTKLALKRRQAQVLEAELEAKKKERDLLNMEQLVETQRMLNAKQLDDNYRRALEAPKEPPKASAHRQEVVDVEDVVRDFRAGDKGVA